MSNFSALALPVVSITAWGIAGWLIASSLRKRNIHKLAAGIVGTFGGFLIGLIFFIIGLIVTDEKEPATSTQQSLVPTQKSTDVSPANRLSKESLKENSKTLDLTSEVFSKRMNTNLKSFGMNYKFKLKMNKLEHASVGKFHFENQIGFMATGDNKTGKLTGIMIMSPKTGDMSTGMSILAISISSVSAIMGENGLKTDQSSDVVTGLIKGSFPDDFVVVDNIRYSYVKSNEANTFFIRPL
ncbi:hypothetical protein F4826_000311 [Rahnella inusitata]|nr:hypothetical protein [Rahnella inusitata]